MTVQVEPARLDDKPIIQCLMQLYLYDYMEFEAGLELDRHGLFNYNYLDHYWVEAGRHPFLIRVDGTLAGFALVRTLEPASDEHRWYSMAEFFVMRRYRRRGVGQAAACQVFDRFRGRWEVGQDATNPGATRFWRRVIGRYTDGHYEEERLDSPPPGHELESGGVVQSFTAPGVPGVSVATDRKEEHGEC